MKHLFSFLVGTALFAAALPLPAQDAGQYEPEPALPARLADQSLLLDVVRFNGGFVAVGQRGHVLLSDDGQTWTQAEQVPVQSTLTRVAREGRRLWAIGQDATILSSADGGRTWFIQHWEPQTESADGEDLPDLPLLDAAFITALKGFAVGAYGRFMSTTDGGVTWQVERMEDRVTREAIDWAEVAREQDDYDAMSDDMGMADDEGELFVDKGCYEFYECHLNDLLVLEDGRMMIAAERGYGYRSTDEGQTWESFRFPYTGSMFGLIELDGCVIAYGLRGNIQKSCDFGNSWERLSYDGDQTLMGATYLPDGRVLMVGAAAARVTLDADGNIETTSDRLGSDYAAVMVEDGHLILVGEDGVRYE